ncbi:MAG: GNAT family N-acetyltransferase, partial [Pseudomonadota bacterium]
GAVSRAALRAGASAEATIAVHVRKKKRKELGRLRKRLEEKGAVCFREFTHADDLEDWADAFLTLEDKSWKGRQGTSLKSTQRDADWFKKTLAGARDHAMLHFLRLDLDGRPIAMLTTLLSNGAGYSLKIAYDPEFARFSPGVMIKIEAMRSLLNREDFQFADSCASPDHSMINGLWRTRRIITGLNISGRQFAARSTLGAARMLERARASLPKG